MAIKNNKRGFTLLEILFSLVIISAVIVGVFSLMSRTTAFLPTAANRLIAGYLSQEGIEIVRNLRDSNKLDPAKQWNYGLTDCTAGCEADYLSQTLTPWQAKYLRNDGNFYNYSASALTSFQRKITIDSSGADVLKISVQVFWREKTLSHNISVIENLYKW